MFGVIKRDILSVLGKLLAVLSSGEKNPAEIKELGNDIIHNASVFQDEDSISIAVLIYALSKIMERKQELDYAKVIGFIKSAISNLKNEQHDLFEKSIAGIFNYIRATDQKINLYIHEVIQQAQVKKGCNLCEHGISVARASEIFGISQWELMHYLGKTTLIDKFSEPVNEASRLKFARDIFS